MTGGRVDHVHLFTPEAEALAELLAALPGGSVAARYEGWKGALTVVVVIGGTRINVTAAASVPAGAGPAAHVGVAVTDLDGTVERLRRAGHTIVSEPHPWAPERILDDDGSLPLAGRFAFVAAPGGVEVELIERDADPSAGGAQ